MQVEAQRQRPHVKRWPDGGRRAYMTPESDELVPKEEKQTQTELGLVSAGRTRFVTPRLVLGKEDTPFAKAFAGLCHLIRSPAWKSSLLVVLGHDPEKRRDELERKIREDEASEAIDGALRVFFDSVLAPLLQERETAHVNTIHECVQQELQAQQRVIQNQQQRLTQLTEQIEDWEKQVSHLKGKVDRRVAESNALRKEQYRQLLMLRDIMGKQGSEPGALSALNEAIATVLAGKQHEPVPAPETAQSKKDPDQFKAPGRGSMAVNANAQVLHREKEKWEQRAREASSQCQELRDQLARLTQENLTHRESEAVPWFLHAENAAAERQRIADAVGSYQGTWEDIGDALAELLNNDILWAAVEQSARRGSKRRTARGLEAVLAQLDSWTQPPSSKEETASDNGEEDPALPQFGRKHSTFAELGRLIPCRACNGVGHVQGDADANDADSYLRKTLEQVLELKTQLENATTKTLTLEGQLQLTHMQAEQLQETLHQAELVKASAVDSCLQTDLDDEEGLDLDEIMRSAYDQDTPATDTPRARSRQNRRNTQYEHLIVELKSTLADKDEGLAGSRRALDVAQARTASLQRALQKEKDTHAQELAMLKTSLSFSLKTRNTKIEERQAAVKLLLKKFAKKVPQQLRAVKQMGMSLLPPTQESKHGEEDDDSDDDKDASSSTNSMLVETNAGEQGEVKRMETMIQRYAEDVVRVRKEHETQQELLKKAEAEIAEEDTKRSRTNSISQGNLVVSLASHPRDLFKALSTAQGDMLKLRRASQRSSALQTDRLLTLTTHLGHMSEELCTVRKRNLAELEFWKLECEKLQNANKALEAEQQIFRKQLQEARHEEQLLLGEASSRLCSMCEKHKKRLLQISNELMNQTQTSRTDPEVEVPAPSTLTSSEQNLVSNALLDLESIYSGMTAAKQQLARELVVTHLNSALSPRSTRRTTVAISRPGSKEAKSNNQGATVKDGGSPVSTRSTPSSPRKIFASPKGSKSSRQLKKTAELSDGKPKASPSPTRVNQESPAPVSVVNNDNAGSETAHERTSLTLHRKTLVQEILEGGGFSLTKHGLAQTSEVPNTDLTLENNADSDNNADVNTNHPASNAPDDSSSGLEELEPQDVPVFDDKEDLLTLNTEDPAFMSDSNDIVRDPEVIQQLRLLINQSSAAKERVAATGWQILVFRLLYLAGTHRLGQLKATADRRAKIQADGTLGSTNYKINSMCDAMARIVQQRKAALDAALSARDISRRDLKKSQAHVMTRNSPSMVPKLAATKLIDLLFLINCS
ncbi:hypothetical protein PHYPSEUDO_010157 [Phytophthora pseudosyringae]|uniref:Uncharacterized protein n=1 Tax=Phytophthora pseudosyringae TaxID=221518 RepID=A0A8T1VBR1_9STRA|nr:hypothetical protein PHYPSEUDO_010157 [Phytophthora pseudosyringae]